MSGDYRGLVGAIRSAIRRSDSLLFRTYTVASVLVGGFATVLLVLGVVSWLATPAPIGQRALLGVIALLLLVPLLAPVLVVARRHRRGVGDRRADAVVGLAGFGFVLSVYLALLISDPNPHAVTGPLGPAIAAIDAVPRSYWILPLLLAVAGILTAVRLTRPTAPSAADGDAEG